MRRLAVGILAHVDAGKTTLSEGLLYESGMIKMPGRVDNRNAFLDTEELERQRGITIFSKQALIQCGESTITLLDTPGHVDFSAEMERTIWVMDYAVLVVSGTDGVQGHTRTLWKLLERYQIPVFVFINKMDQPGTDAKVIMEELHRQLGNGCIDFCTLDDEEREEQIAVCDEAVMERYLEGEGLTEETIADMVQKRKVFPCYFGSALKLEGVDFFLKGMLKYMRAEDSKQGFGARVYKVARDDQGNRLTYMKITGGSLRVKDSLTGTTKAGIHHAGMGEMQEEGIRQNWTEKVNQIRIYSGDRYEAVSEVLSGTVCAVTGLNESYPGEGLGVEADAGLPILEPVLTYSVELPEEIDAMQALPFFRQLEEEEPELCVQWQEESGTIQIKLMGEVQIEVMRKRIADRFGIDVRFGEGDIVYKETIADTVEGVGHFEPLRHYAEVHLLLEPGEPGSGMQLLTACSEDMLDRNWQRLILTHLEEKEHVGVLTGSPLTDVRITVTAGRAHAKHTEGGDFRQATYRAVRQGLMQAQSVLLEPYYDFRLDIPAECVGRAMTDIGNMQGQFEPPVLEEERAVLTGSVPVAAMRGYPITVNSYTGGRGTLVCTLGGYGPCHNAEEIVEQIDYHPEEDTANPSSSVFCSHGAGFIVPWNQVTDYMHVESQIKADVRESEAGSGNLSGELSELDRRKAELSSQSLDEEQIEEIMKRTFRANERTGKHYRRKKADDGKRVLGWNQASHAAKAKVRAKEKYLVVDGYNIIHSWDELKDLVKDNLDGARMRLLDILSNYQAVIKGEVMVVFDGYRVKGNPGEMLDYQGIHVVYTKQEQTADSYIEKLTHQLVKDYQVTVATSDGLVQMITRGQNCTILSARELKEELERVNESLAEYMSENEGD
ncbi:MAG: TetM/TetW/TetO/TetS family tetracycline resistance ribosomal protection protein [Clostridium sp.]|nr:TetM/TetW/TetO/TetS family tetracycline resistance ribosomal protection protein [Clostridium sp.]